LIPLKIIFTKIASTTRCYAERGAVSRLSVRLSVRDV